MPQREAEILPFAREEIERSLPERFAKVVAARSSFLAIAAGEDRLTYAELSRRADALAAEILRRQGDSAAPVAMLVRDPVAIVTAIFATWQAGKLCVPIDAALPSGRVESILRHSQSELLITDRSPAFSPTMMRLLPPQAARASFASTRLLASKPVAKRRRGFPETRPPASSTPRARRASRRACSEPTGAFFIAPAVRSHRSVYDRRTE